jgi:ATP-dependent DNA ligase
VAGRISTLCKTGALPKLPIYFIALDCLRFEERGLLDKAIEERKKVLAKVTEDFLKPLSRYSSSARNWTLAQQFQSYARPKSKA